MSDAAISVRADPSRLLAFDVIVRDSRGESRHRVTISGEDEARWGRSGADPARCVEAAMAFLIDREPKEAILAAFDMDVIRRYFPDFDAAFPGYLARFGDGPRSRA